MLQNNQILIIIKVVALNFFFISAFSTAQALRDPTLPGQGYAAASSSVNQPESLILNSIINSSKPHAVINNKIVYVGESIEGVRIEYIGKHYVNLSDGRKLKLFQSITER